MYISEYFINNMYRGMLRIELSKCGGCGDCISICQSNAIHKENGLVRIDNLKCNHCNKCIKFCLTQRGNAIKII